MIYQIEVDYSVPLDNCWGGGDSIYANGLGSSPKEILVEAANDENAIQQAQEWSQWCAQKEQVGYPGAKVHTLRVFHYGIGQCIKGEIKTGPEKKIFEMIPSPPNKDPWDDALRAM